ncbi:MAG: ABC transporter substrate-binding protein [Erysipelotrichaceae bacterium]|nr:ABC transporter substrate-binding protein [Erysipelotrichaceae bacterium]
MKKSSALWIVITAMLLILVGCSGSTNKEKLYVYNWGDYIDETIIDEFEEEFGVEVVYDTYATNEDLYVKIKQGGTKYDIAIPSDYMIEKMIREAMLEKIDLAKIENFSTVGEQYKDLPFDPGNQYSVPYMWGTVGIIYNTSMIEEDLDSWSALWNPGYSKQILMLDSQRDSIAIALKKLGYSMNSRSVDELEAAKAALIEQKPLVLAYAGDNLKDMMIGGEAAIAVCWSGDAIYMISENPELKYILPKEGSNLWFDNVVIPKGAENVDLAHKFIDFLSRPEISLKNVEYIGYSTPNTEALGMLDPETAQDKTAYPDAEDLQGFEVFRDPGNFIETYNRIWTEVKSSK